MTLNNPKTLDQVAQSLKSGAPFNFRQHVADGYVINPLRDAYLPLTEEGLIIDKFSAKAQQIIAHQHRKVAQGVRDVKDPDNIVYAVVRDNRLALVVLQSGEVHYSVPTGASKYWHAFIAVATAALGGKL